MVQFPPIKERRNEEDCILRPHVKTLIGLPKVEPPFHDPRPHYIWESIGCHNFDEVGIDLGNLFWWYVHFTVSKC